MNVLSLFDGMSCGQQALQKANIQVTNYYASEIDKYAIQITQKNYPNTIQIGSVIDVRAEELPQIDLLIGGSPCQNLSFAGSRKGLTTKENIEILTLEHYLELKADGFKFEGQSYLFWEYMRLLHEVKPKYFLLENVEMGEKWEKVLSKAIGVNGVHINSALVSAQNRKRIYWTNIGHVPGGLFGDLVCTIKQPKDKGIMLKDILEKDVDQKYYLSDKMIAGMFKQNEKNASKGNGFHFKPKEENEKGNAITNPAKMRVDDNYIVHNTMPRSGDPTKGGTGHLSHTDGKTYCLDTGSTNAVEIVAQRGRDNGNGNQQQLEPRTDGKTNCLTSVQKDNLVFTKNFLQLPGYRIDNQVFYEDNKHGTLDTHANRPKVLVNNIIRRLTPTECERLQTVKDGYTAIASDSQRYKMLGNGWTVDVIAYIFSYINATTLQK